VFRKRSLERTKKLCSIKAAEQVPPTQSGRIPRSGGVLELDIPKITPTIDVLLCLLAWPRDMKRIVSTYQTTQVFTPRASRPILVEIVQQHDEADQNTHQCPSSDQPPSPPGWFPALEKAHRLLREFLDATITTHRLRGDRTIR